MPLPRPRHAKARHANATQSKAMPTQGKAKPRQGQGKASQSQRKARQAQRMARQARKNTKCRMGSLAKFRGKVEWKRRGRDESKRRRAESRWIAIIRPPQSRRSRWGGNDV
ncbi:unnamed protein product [Prunus brigantina]